jgi:hypothetical protein
VTLLQGVNIFLGEGERVGRDFREILGE